MEWIAITSLVLSFGAFLLNVFGVRQKTLKERRDDSRQTSDDLEDCEREKKELREENMNLKQDNYDLLVRTRSKRKQ